MICSGEQAEVCVRRDHRPYWLKVGMDRINQLIVDHRCVPQLDSAGHDFRVMNPRHLQISGPNIHVGSHVHVMALSDSPVRIAVFEGLGRITIGNYVIINPGVRISSASAIEVGDNCMLAMNCYLADADWHDLQHRIYPPGNTAPIRLGDNVWIGDSAFVGKGVSIGDNSIVGAYSVVTKDVPANVIVAGTPAGIVKELPQGPRTRREDLFTGETPFDVFEAGQQRQRLAGNTLFSWLRSVVLPGVKD
jgi:acetyltransferase-like isoleucine patch superfamily enzyme